MAYIAAHAPLKVSDADFIDFLIATPKQATATEAQRTQPPADAELLLRHAPVVRRLWRTLGPDRVIRLAQARAERRARFNRRQVLRSDDWLDQSLPF
jgi:hypothetical protein